MSRHRDLILGLVVACAAASLAGCKTHRDFTVQSDPPGAKVILDGISQGTTPCVVRLSTKPRSLIKTHYMCVDLGGYHRAEKVFKHEEHYPKDGSTLSVPLTPKGAASASAEAEAPAAAPATEEAAAPAAAPTTGEAAAPAETE